MGKRRFSKVKGASKRRYESGNIGKLDAEERVSAEIAVEDEHSACAISSLPVPDEVSVSLAQLAELSHQKSMVGRQVETSRSSHGDEVQPNIPPQPLFDLIPPGLVVTQSDEQSTLLVTNAAEFVVEEAAVADSEINVNQKSCSNECKLREEVLLLTSTEGDKSNHVAENADSAIEIGFTDADLTDSQLWSEIDSNDGKNRTMHDTGLLGFPNGSNIIRGLTNELSSLNKLLLAAKKEMTGNKQQRAFSGRRVLHNYAN